MAQISESYRIPGELFTGTVLSTCNVLLSGTIPAFLFLLITAAEARAGTGQVDTDQPDRYTAAINDDTEGRIIRVCPRDSTRTDCQSFSLTAALETAGDGDTLVLSPGEYREAGILRASHVTIRGEPGAHIRDATAEGKASLVIKGNDTIVSGIECSGARVADHNGACIRLEGNNLLVTGVYFHHNEYGILTGSGENSDIIVEYSEFAFNGDGTGKTHNLYIGNVRSFTLRGCLSHHAVTGHLVKSRAQTSTIAYNRLMDGPDGTSSYSIDLPNGGTTYVIGNIIQKGPQSENSAVIAFAGEGASNQGMGLYVVNNTIINDRPSGGIIVRNWSDHPARMVNNIFKGNNVLTEGPAQAENNLVSRQYSIPGLIRYALSNPVAVWNNPEQLLTMYKGMDLKFANPDLYDYRLSISSPAIDSGIDPGAVNGTLLRPAMEYSHPTDLTPRPSAGQIDIGAYEYVSP